MNRDEFRKLPGVDFLLKQKELQTLREQYGEKITVDCTRQIVDLYRKKVIDGGSVPGTSVLLHEICRLAETLGQSTLRQVINATGVIVHTNLGRAPLGSAVLEKIAPLLQGYCNLEFDLVQAGRGHRETHLQHLMSHLAGSESAIAVNNNAAAVFLILNTLARGREVLISRGELIEIGGAFRIPDIMRESGAIMVEVGTTNRTRISDYEKAITPETALIVKAHKSNYTIEGFVGEPDLCELVALSKKHGIPFFYDLGSGLIRKPAGLPLDNEPDVVTCMKAGIDLVSFSCDKLLGGPQAGIVAGSHRLISKLSSAPLMRVFRTGRLTMAVLAAVLATYNRDEDLLRDNPVFEMMSRTEKRLRESAVHLSELLARQGVGCHVVGSQSYTGGGSLPRLVLPSFAVELIGPTGDRVFAERVYHQLLRQSVPVLGLLREGRLSFDVRTLTEDNIERIPAFIASAIREYLSAPDTN